MARIDDSHREMAYRFYITDGIMAIANNTTIHVSGGARVDMGTGINQRYAEIVIPELRPKPKPVDKRTPEEFADDIWKRANIGR